MDTSESGDLSSCHLLGEYSLTQEFTSLTKSDQLNYSINVHNDGNTLEVVSMCCEYGAINKLSLGSWRWEDNIKMYHKFWGCKLAQVHVQ